jgi:hypothetical protein
MVSKNLRLKSLSSRSCLLAFALQPVLLIPASICPEKRTWQADSLSKLVRDASAGFARLALAIKRELKGLKAE